MFGQHKYMSFIIALVKFHMDCCYCNLVLMTTTLHSCKCAQELLTWKIDCKPPKYTRLLITFLWGFECSDEKNRLSADKVYCACNPTQNSAQCLSLQCWLFFIQVLGSAIPYYDSISTVTALNLSLHAQWVGLHEALNMPNLDSADILISCLQDFTTRLCNSALRDYFSAQGRFRMLKM